MIFSKYFTKAGRRGSLSLPSLLPALMLMAAVAAHGQKHYVGGDLSLLTKYEQQKAQYLDSDGKSIPDLLAYLKTQGWNTIRVRLMVDPTKSDDQKQVVQDLEYVKALGKRIKDAGLMLMLDFHYSDTWADPVAQWTPSAWLSLGDAQLQQKLYEYTRDCLQELVGCGATPDFIQTGNEISYGMLWGAKGSSANRCFSTSDQANWNRFFALLRKAEQACREVCPQAKIIIHSERAARPNVLIDYFNRMQTAKIDYDVIGLSYYPYFHGDMQVLETAIKQLVARNYGKDIQVVEMGYPSKWEVNGTTFDYRSVYPYSNEGQRRFLADLIDMLQKYPQVNGLSWWYAEANAKGCRGDLATDWYNAGLFDNSTGRALPALYELKSYTDGDQETVLGDVNGDGAVDVADISAIISVMAGMQQYEEADVNGDGTVDVADISAVITIMAG